MTHAPGDRMEVGNGKSRTRWPRWGTEVLRDLSIALLAFLLVLMLENRLAFNQETLENLRFVRERSEPGVTKPFRNMQLQGANLSGLQLGCDLDDKACRLTNLIDADLRDANMVGIDLRLADMGVADLRGADLRFAQLEGADLVLVDLDGADLRNAQLDGASLLEAELGDAQLSGADLRGVTFTGANLERVNLSGVCFDDSTRWPADLPELGDPDCGDGQ